MVGMMTFGQKRLQEHWRSYIVITNTVIVVEWLALLLHIWKVTFDFQPGSHLS